MTLFKLKIITPDKTFFNNDAVQMVVRTTEGDIGILANHTSYVANLPSGPIRIKQENGEFKTAAVSSGLIKISKDGVSILATAVEWADEIDIERAKQAEDDARKRLINKLSQKEFEEADLRLKRALNRLSIANKH